MGKDIKLQFSFLNSIQICRPKDPSLLVKGPLPALTYFSKTYDISLPSFADPPPSPPDHPSIKYNVRSPKIAPLACPSGSKSCIMHKATSDEKRKLYNSLSSTLPNERARPNIIAPSRSEESKEKTTTTKPKPKLNSTISSAHNDDIFCHGSSSSPPNVMSSCHDFENTLEHTEEEPLNRSKNKSVKQTTVKTRRFKRFGSKEWKDGSMTGLENESREQNPVSGGLVPCMMDRKVNHIQSFVVVKRSVNPYEDFKKSMLEMILEKHIFEPKELEQLLMSFLSLNSRMHHKAILKAFTEIWKEVFSG